MDLVEKVHELDTLDDLLGQLNRSSSSVWKIRVHGNVYSSYGYHKQSASTEWWKLHDYVLDYAPTLNIEDEGDGWEIKWMGCGARNESDRILLIREIHPYAWETEQMNKDDDNSVDSYYYRTRIKYAIDTNQTPTIIYELYLCKMDSLMDYNPDFKAWVEAYKPHTPREGGNMSGELEYEVNEYAMGVDITKNGRTLRLSMDETAELAAFLPQAKTIIKAKRLDALTKQIDELNAQLKQVSEA